MALHAQQLQEVEVEEVDKISLSISATTVSAVLITQGNAPAKQTQ
jgi:hypothetical protein